MAEYFHFAGQTISTVGLRAAISQGIDSGNFRLLLAATILMAAFAVAVSRTIWRPLYWLAERRFKLES